MWLKWTLYINFLVRSYQNTFLWLLFTTNYNGYFNNLIHLITLYFWEYSDSKTIFSCHQWLDNCLPVYFNSRLKASCVCWVSGSTHWIKYCQQIWERASGNLETPKNRNDKRKLKIISQDLLHLLFGVPVSCFLSSHYFLWFLLSRSLIS